MSTKLEEARTLLVKRLDEIDRERGQLIEAIEQLDSLVEGGLGSSENGASAARARKTVRRAGRKASNGRKRAPRGEREKQLLMSIKSNPDYRVSEHARAVGVSPQQLYPLLGRLVEKDAIVKKDSRYTVKAG